ncbi:hypothetical protein CDL15_Pgr016404 [Punica granatum]|uniref:Uncharacterized protein n=1 Tax=Punica granatum TaxID=22663 RepID=A0A218WG03_PUNGR|nr:hypothetical protein CDL15_Pgr016404 [Punica granatum]
MQGRNPKVNAGLKPKSECGVGARRGVEAQCSKCGAGARRRAEARCEAKARCNKCEVDRKGSKPNAVNAGPEPDAGLKPVARPKPDAINARLIGKCKKCESKGQC